MKQNTKKKTGIFYYVFYLGFLIVCMVFAACIVEYFQTGEMNKKLSSQTLVIIVGFFGAFYSFRKNEKKMMDQILGEAREGTQNILHNKKNKRKVEQTVRIAIQFGYDKGIKRLEKLAQKAESYDDKAIFYFLMGLFYERIEEYAYARNCYNRALQYRPFFALAMNKLEESEHS